MQVTVVTIQQICTACHIVEGAVREIMQKLQKRMPDLEVQWVVYEDTVAAFKHPGLELPNFPAVFFRGEQMTAGTIPTVLELRSWFEGGEQK
jgi:hypothetical protein